MARKSPKGKQKETPEAEATSAVVVAPPTKDDKISKEERMKRFKELCLRRNEARNANRNEVVAENQRNKTSVHEVAKREKAQKKLDQQVKRAQVEQAGGDYDRQICMDVDAQTSERWHLKAQPKENSKFDDHRMGAVRKYNNQMHKFKPDLAEYERRKLEAALGDDGHLTYGGDGKVSTKDLDRLGDAMAASIAKTEARHRRKEFFAEADVDYINRQNERYNAKLRRAYDPYTKAIKSNLERGTAL